MRFRFGLFVLLCAAPLLLSCAGNTRPSTNTGITDGERECVELSNRHDSDKAITKCTAELNVKGLSRDREWSALLSRGNAYGDKGEYALAIADYSQILATNPYDMGVRENRARTYVLAQQVDSAVSDFTRLMGFWSNEARLYEARALAYFVQGKFDLAITDLERAVDLEPKGASGYIWLYLTKRRYGRDASDVLKRATNVDQRTWPAVILKFIQRQVPEQSVYDETYDAPPEAQGPRDCRAAVFLGEFALIEGRTATAEHQFNYATQGCPRGQLERAVAEAELKLMP